MLIAFIALVALNMVAWALVTTMTIGQTAINQNFSLTIKQLHQDISQLNMDIGEISLCIIRLLPNEQPTQEVEVTQ